VIAFNAVRDKFISAEKTVSKPRCKMYIVRVEKRREKKNVNADRIYFYTLLCMCVSSYLYMYTDKLHKKIMYVQAILLDFTICEFTFIILYSCMVFLPKFIIHI
jgi:hypothetical protein